MFVPTADPVKEKDSETGGYAHWLWEALAKSTLRCVFTMVVIFSMLGFCIVSYLYCKLCLFVVVLLCLVCCICIPGLNAPLWFAIVLLWLSGYSFSNGQLRLTWN